MIVQVAGLYFAAFFVCLAGTVAPARAGDCPPLRMATSVPMAYDASGRPFVPVKIGTAKKFMLVDTGGGLSVIGQQTVDELGLDHVRVAVAQYSVSGAYTDQAADASPFAIGNLVAQHMQFMIDPDKSEFGGDAAGVIGPTILRFYDVDFDFGANKFNLMLPDHCPGKVIYWPASGVAVVPMQVTKAVGHIIVPVTLDGVKLNALIDTGASTTFVTSLVAESDFGLKPGAPDVPDAGPLKGAPGARIYRHRFHSLSLEGIAVNNPDIDIVPDLNRHLLSTPPPIGTRIPTNDEAAGLEDITIGVDVLKHLHLYIAYKEKMLYATPAEPAPAGVAAASAAAH